MWQYWTSCAIHTSLMRQMKSDDSSVSHLMHVAIARPELLWKLLCMSHT